MRLSIFLFLFICSSSVAQTNSYQNLLDTAFKGHGDLFVHSKPLKITRLDPKEMWYYAEILKEYSNQKLDTVMFLQIIQNTRSLDTTLWRDNENPFALLVNSRDETVSKKYAIQKFSLTDKRKIKFYRKQINQFNATETFNRNISYFSRPIFDNSKTFAIVQWDNGHGGLGGGGTIILYHLQGGTWNEIGIIMNWKY